MEKFNPNEPEYKKVEDLPKEERKKFRDVKGGGFIGEEAFLYNQKTPIDKQIEESNGSLENFSDLERQVLTKLKTLEPDTVDVINANRLYEITPQMLNDSFANKLIDAGFGKFVALNPILFSTSEQTLIKLVKKGYAEEVMRQISDIAHANFPYHDFEDPNTNPQEFDFDHNMNTQHRVDVNQWNKASYGKDLQTALKDLAPDVLERYKNYVRSPDNSV